MAHTHTDISTLRLSKIDKGKQKPLKLMLFFFFKPSYFFKTEINLFLESGIPIEEKKPKKAHCFCGSKEKIFFK